MTPQRRPIRQNSYEDLFVYKKAVVISAVTDIFNKRFIKDSKLSAQITGAARSVKQNIVEGVIDDAGSKKTGLILLIIARGSLHELKEDYKDYLMFNRIPCWETTDPRTEQLRNFCRTNDNPTIYQDKLQTRSVETIVNLAMTLIHQEDNMLQKFIYYKESEFLKNGGLTEQLYACRREAREAINRMRHAAGRQPVPDTQH